MTQILLPTDADFVETVARAIAKDRLFREATVALDDMMGVRIDAHASLEQAFDRVFEMMWSGTTDLDERQKAGYRNDARAAISAINLKLLTS
jgi:hypothetical protein